MWHLIDFIIEVLGPILGILLVLAVMTTLAAIAMFLIVNLAQALFW